MSQKTTFILFVLIALAGVLFSGYLTYYHYWGGGCQKAIVSCGGGGQTVLIFGLPTCVYGFFMFLLVAVLALLGLGQKKRSFLKANLIISLVGTLFALAVSIYEIWIIKIAVSGLPACVYGFFIYLALLIVSVIGSKTGPGILPAVPPSQPASPNVGQSGPASPIQ